MQEKKHSPAPQKSNSKNLTNSVTDITSTHTDELVIALCGPIGSPIHKVSDEIIKILEDDFKYTCILIKLSDIIKEKKNIIEEQGKRFKYIKEMIDKGNDLRSEFGNSILADLAIVKIASRREDPKSTEGIKIFRPQRICHIIDSIKNQQELDKLRKVYREMLYFMGIFSPVSFRQENLKEQGMSLSEVGELIDRDSGEEIHNGQTVRETFPSSDFFLRVNSDTDQPLIDKLERFLNIIFGVGILTPTKDEKAMYSANSAAGNSACLSRQVGAALTDEQGELLSVGWNDVPKAGGGLYGSLIDEPLQEKDDRCMHLKGGVCFNDSTKSGIIEEIANSLAVNKLIQVDDWSKVIKVLQDSKINSLLEFSRSIHAEMHAIILGSQLGGNKVRNGKLYCTTYPCHPCARHIIASGIKEVYYIEPYRKSLAIVLHKDAITEDEKDMTKVKILSFEGVAPSRYLNLFKMKSDSRKDNQGKRIQINKETAFPVNEVSIESIPVLEGLVVSGLENKSAIEVNRGGKNVQ